MAALGSEIGRMDGQLKEEVSEALARVSSLLGDGDDDARGYIRLALLVGAVTISPLAKDKVVAEAIMIEALASYGKV